MHVNISFEPSDGVKLKADIFETLKYIQYTLISYSYIKVNVYIFDHWIYVFAPELNIIQPNTKYKNSLLSLQYNFKFYS